MRAAVSRALALLALAALSLTSSTSAVTPLRADSTPGRLAHCAAKADQASLAAHSKASSFAPQRGPQNHVYGVPIQPRIFKSKPKKNPQLKSTALPES
jgi:hypothetical protein